jgi:hypothetical protein
MPTTRSLAMLLLALPLMLAFPKGTFADPPDRDPPGQSAAATSAAAAAQEDNDATLQPAEPDFRLINLPTTMRLPLFKGNFALTHRFAGNFRRGSFSDQFARLFGIDDGAVVGFEYRFGIARHLEAVAYRTSNARTIQLYAKYDLIHQGASLPFSASVIASIEGTDNLQEQFAPAIGVSLSRLFGDVAAVYAVPMWVHNSAAATGVDRDTSFIGVGARVRIRPTVYLAAEISPRVSGYAPGESQYGFAIEKRAGGHMFQLNFTNGSGTTLAQIARGGQPESLALGFNLSRKFF